MVEAQRAASPQIAAAATRDGQNALVESRCAPSYVSQANTPHTQGALPRQYASRGKPPAEIARQEKVNRALSQNANC